MNCPIRGGWLRARREKGTLPFTAQERLGGFITMNGRYLSSLLSPHLPLWGKMLEKRRVLSFELEVTARCNNNCRHCYINVPAGDDAAKAQEPSFQDIDEIADESLSLGALWCSITGGEPLLREDFFDIYLSLKRKGLLVTLFTNATLVTGDHVRLFKKYPPRDLEVTLYGWTEDTYERVTRTPGSFKAFRRGMNLLLRNGVKVRLKTMALRSNTHELPQIARFCRRHTKDYFRFDPFLHLRYDRNPSRNAEISAERLSPAEISALEGADPDRSAFMKKARGQLIIPQSIEAPQLFLCGAGKGTFCISHQGGFLLCSSLRHPDCVYDLKKGSLADAWNRFVPRVLEIQPTRLDFLEKCMFCSYQGICMWCPATAHLETGEMDAPADYFCQVAHERARLLKSKEEKSDSQRRMKK